MNYLFITQVTAVKQTPLQSSQKQKTAQEANMKGKIKIHR